MVGTLPQSLQKCELCPRKEGALKRTDSGGKLLTVLYGDYFPGRIGGPENIDRFLSQGIYTSLVQGE